MGLATAQVLAAKGALVSLADISETALLASKATLERPYDHLYVPVDVSKSQSVDAWIQETVRHFGRLDGAVNMAGVIAAASPVTEVSDDDWDRTFSVNTRGVFNCMRAQLKSMSAGGSIVSELPLQIVTRPSVLNSDRCPRRVSSGSLAHRATPRTAQAKRPSSGSCGRQPRRLNISASTACRQVSL